MACSAPAHVMATLDVIFATGAALLVIATAISLCLPRTTPTPSTPATLTPATLTPATPAPAPDRVR